MSSLRFGRISLATLALTVAGMAAFLCQAQMQDDMAAHGMQRQAMQACAKACTDCQRACDDCATYCARMITQGKKEHLASLMTCRDCADFCSAAARIVSRGGPMAKLICTSCAEACEQCGKTCEAFGDDMHMKACAEECRKCEAACKAMVKQL